MIKKKGLFVILLLVTLMVLSFASMAFTESATNEQQEIRESIQLNQSRQQRLQENAQANEAKQIRLQECEEPCDPACEPKQSKLQKSEDFNEQKSLNRQQRYEVRKQINNG